MTPLIYAGLDSYDRLSFLNKDKGPVIEAVIEVTGIGFDQIRRKSRLREFVTARSLICHYLRKYTKLTLQQIGDLIGGRNHATVINSLSMHEDLFQVDSEFRKLSTSVEEILIKQLKVG